jgi:hypothetical protein
VSERWPGHARAAFNLTSTCEADEIRPFDENFSIVAMDMKM